MPISSYTLIYRNAKLFRTQQELVLGWIEKTTDSLSQIK